MPSEKGLDGTHAQMNHCSSIRITMAQTLSLLTEGKLTGDTLKAMREASVPPQIIYALQTHRIASDGGAERISTRRTPSQSGTQRLASTSTGRPTTARQNTRSTLGGTNTHSRAKRSAKS